MDGIREWGAAICCAAVGCCVLQILIPKNGVGKLFHLLLITFLLCSMISPLLKVSTSLPLDVDFLGDQAVSDALTEKVNEQLQEQVKTTVTDMVQECLATRNVTAETVTVTTALADNGSIYIQQVVIVVDKRNLNAALPVREVLKTQLNTDVIVQSRDG